jgi:RHS repeat-associated protein
VLTDAGSLVVDRPLTGGPLTRTTTLGKVVDSTSYNGFGEVTAYTVTYNTSEIFKILFPTYDKLGRIKTKTETTGGTTNTFNYDYDLNGRLNEVKKNDTVAASYTYDSNGNRLTGPGLSAIPTPTYDDQDRLKQYAGTSYSYSDNGELLTKTTGALVTTYDYDVLGNLRQVVFPGGPTIDYIIDGQNRRIGKKKGGALTQGFLYQDRLKPIAELDPANNVVSRFVYATHVNVPDYMIKGNVTYRIITDNLGSPRLVIDVATGTVAQRLDYDEFGNVTADSSPGFQPFGFAGGLYDPDTKLIRFGARDYDAETGRWTAKDPILFEGGDTNVYSYTGQNPVRNTDPLGLVSPGNVEYCKMLAKTIEHVEKTIGRRKGQLHENYPRKLAESCPGDDVKGSLSRQSHRRMINMDKANLAGLKALYSVFCADPPPPSYLFLPDPEPFPTLSLDPDAAKNAAGATIVTGVVVYSASELALWFVAITLAFSGG